MSSGDEERVGIDPGSWKAGTALGEESAHHCSPQAAAPGRWLALSKRLLEVWSVVMRAEFGSWGGRHMKRLFPPKSRERPRGLEPSDAIW